MLKEKLLTPFNAIFLGITIVYGVAVYALTRLYDAPAYFTTSFYSTPLHWATVFFIIMFLSYRVFSIMLFVRPARLTRTIIDDLKTYVTWDRLLAFLPLFFILPVFFSLFTSAKNMIPVIHPFTWDPDFAALDRWLHFGTQPWEWLQPLLGFAAVTFVISVFYKLWFLAKFLVMYWQAFSLSRPALRERFFIALLGIWIVNGTILATLLSSAGPCYFGDLYPGAVDPYAGLMEYLYRVREVLPVYDLRVQEYLWDAYEGDTMVLFSGISAMPSMHVSLAFLFYLLARHYGRATHLFFLGFLIMTIIGSIHLGWHYAADGYLSILTTLPVWWLAGKIVTRYRKDASWTA